MSDIYWDDVVLLLHCNGTDESTTFIDSSGSAHSVTSLGIVEHDTAEKKFGVSSALFEDTSYPNRPGLSVGTSSDFGFGTGDFTVEGWFYMDAAFADRPLVYFGDTGTVFYIAITENLEDHLLDVNFFGGTGSISTGEWHFFAVVRESGVLSAYVDATRQFAESDSTNFGTSQPIFIGTDQLGYSAFQGWLDEIRITKGVARYSGATITVPTEEFYDATKNLVVDSAAQKNSASTDYITQDPNDLFGALTAQQNQSGTGYVTESPETLTAVGNTQKNSAASVAIAFTFPLQITLENRFQVEPGLPIVINRWLTPTFTPLTISISYPVAVTLPITLRVYQAVSEPTLPIVIYSSAGATGQAAALADFAAWKPKCVLGGTDISGKLVGIVTIETEEMAAPVASFSFLPTVGAVDPLAYVGQTVRLSWQKVVAGVVTHEYLRFSGICSDPSWDVDNRVLTISATGDLQSILDRMTKTEIDVLLEPTGGRYSDVIFGDKNDLTGWEYAEALLSTAPFEIWQDAGGAVRTTSFIAKGTADFSFTDAGRFEDSAEISYPSRLDMVNRVRLITSYRFDRLRQRTIGVSWNYTEICPWLVIGFKLPKRTMIESAANSGGWAVQGSIAYVPVWPAGGYQCHSGMDMTGSLQAIGFVNTPEITAEWCIGASWRAARRWVQKVDESHVINVNATESQAAIGILSTDESYAYESEEKDETWETDTNYTDAPAGWRMLTNTDEVGDLDGDRADFEDAQEVAMLKAKHDILRAHRGTQFSFQTVFQPAIDLSHTIHIDCAFVECQGKVSRIADTWDIDSGDARSQITVSLFRHNGAGLTTDTPIAALDKPGDPDETSYTRNIQLLTHLGGRPYSDVYDEDWSGYITNYTDYGLWSHSRDNPNMAGRWYDESFTVKYPDIDEEYADPIDSAAAEQIEVAVPQDLLTFTA